MSNQPTAEQFLESVANHQLTVEMDNGTHRCLLLKRPNSTDCHFRITTWPGHLCISGDMGTFVFSRVQDMFEFFRDSELRINTGYWAEKLQAANVRGYEEHCAESAKVDILDAFEQWKTGYLDDHPAPECIDAQSWVKEERQRLESEVLAYVDYQHELIAAINNWTVEQDESAGADGLEFIDFWEHFGSWYRPTYHYVWCCYAVVWAIQQYDAAKASEVAA